VKPLFGYLDPMEHWCQRLSDGLAHNLSLVIAKAVAGQLAAGASHSDLVRQVAVFGAHNRDGWDTGLTILTALGQLMPFLSEEEAHLALFHGVASLRIATVQPRAGGVRRWQVGRSTPPSKAGCADGWPCGTGMPPNVRC
jgi:hypothetical protein